MGLNGTLPVPSLRRALQQALGRRAPGPRCGEGPIPPGALPAAAEISARYFSRFDLPDGHEHRVGPPGCSGGPLARAVDLAGAALDRATVRGMERLFLASDAPDRGGDVRARVRWHRATYGSQELLERPERFFRPTPALADADLQLRFLNALPDGERYKLIFTSNYRTLDSDYQPGYDAFVGNETNHINLWLHRVPAGRPAALFINPWCSGWLTVDERIYQAEALYRAGYDVALFTLPFHGRRTPRQALFSGQLFPNRELRRTNEAFGQTVADLRALMGWLRRRRGGGGPIGVIGLSLGGYAAALLACLEPELAFVVSIMAPSSLADGLWQQGRNSPAKREAEEAGFTLDDLRHIWAVHCPLVLPLKVPKERLLLVWSEGDRVIPRVHVLAQWERWGRPAIRAYRGGHLLQAQRGRYLADVRRWLEGIL